MSSEYPHLQCHGDGWSLAALRASVLFSPTPFQALGWVRCQTGGITVLPTLSSTGAAGRLHGRAADKRRSPRGLEQPGRELQSLVHPCRKAEVPRAPLPPGHSAISCLQEAAACQLHAFPLPVVSSWPHGSICTQGSISSVKYIKKNNKNAFGCFFFFPKIFFPVTFFIPKYLNTPLSKSLLP